MEFTLRNWKMQDAEALVRHADNPNIARNLRNVFPNPYTRSDAEGYIQMCLTADETAQISYAIDVNGEAVGSIGVFFGADVYCKSAELGYWLSEAYWGQDIMSRAAGQICREAFAKFDIVRIFAEPFADNTASRRVLEKAGFALEGIMKSGVFKNGELHDYCMYALVRTR